jgi:enoyl-CoA hydratase
MDPGRSSRIAFSKRIRGYGSSVPKEVESSGSAVNASEVLVDRRDDGIVLLTLNRPRANALSMGLLAQLAETISELAADPPGAIVIWGGEKIFAAGADVSEITGPDAAAKISDGFKAVTSALSAIETPSIAAIAGFALGGGLELAMGCDFRVAAPGARLGQPEILLGIIPGGGGTQRLARLVGPSRAKDLVMTGRHLSAQDALSWGLVDRVSEDGKVLDEALELASVLARGPRLAIAAAKRAVDHGLDGTLEDGLAIERDEFVGSLGTKDAKHGVESFLEHGPGKATFIGE